MTYLEAQKQKEENLHIIGLKYNGNIIEELIIHPTKPKEFEKFITEYLDEYDFEKAIQSFKETDLIVSAVFDKKNTWERNVFLQTPLHNLKNEDLNLNL